MENLTSTLASLRRFTPGVSRRGVVILACCSVAACSQWRPDVPTVPDPRQQKRVYVGVAGAVTRLQPLTSGSAYSLAESASSGMAVTLGMDISRRTAIEFTAAALGTAQLAPIPTAGPGVTAEALDYSSVAGSMLFYALGRRDSLAQRRGLAGFARLGLNRSTISADIDLDEQEQMQVFVGAGLEYMFGRASAARAEVVGYDGDATAVQAGLVYRFGRSRPRPPGPRVQKEPDDSAPGQSAQASTSEIAGAGAQAASSQAPENPDLSMDAPPVVAILEPAATVAAATLPRSDLQQEVAAQTESVLAGQNSQLPIKSSLARVPPVPVVAGPAPGPDVIATEPRSLSAGVLRGVDFFSGTSELTATGTRLLLRLAQQLAQTPDVQIEIQTHTDVSMGDAAMTLTRQRAVAVARVLIAAGVGTRQLAARAFGSNKPRASNAQAGGRRINNRVEITRL